MKFLCVTCDEPMKLQEAAPPTDGSISAVFGCPACSHQIAMLTNPYETQLVQSLGVKIGPAQAAEAAAAPTAGGAAATASSTAAAAAVGIAAPTDGASAPAAAASMSEAAAAGGCPFSGMIAEMEGRQEGVAWTDTALQRLENIPEFVRPMAKQGIEHYAKTNGHQTIDDDVMEEARGRFGM